MPQYPIRYRHHPLHPSTLHETFIESRLCKALYAVGLRGRAWEAFANTTWIPFGWAARWWQRYLCPRGYHSTGYTTMNESILEMLVRMLEGEKARPQKWYGVCGCGTITVTTEQMERMDRAEFKIEALA